MRTLLFSTLYPSGSQPLRGVFVETRLRELLRTGRVHTKVVAPIPWVPATRLLGSYGQRAAAPRVENLNGIEVHHPRYVVVPKVGMNLAPFLLALGALGTVRRLMEEGFDFDVIDAHYYYPDGVAAALLASWLGKPLVVTARGTDVNLIPDFWLPRKWLRWASRQANASIGVSAALVERMRALRFESPLLQVMRNGVDLERFHPRPTIPAREALGVTGSPILLTVGNLHEHKGQHLAVSALALLRRSVYPDARLLVVGVGPDRQRLESQCAALGLEGVVRFVGAVPNADLVDWYSAADALILGSSREGWPNVLLESMACGTPVVATAVGGVGEMITAPEAGRMVSERTPEAFAAALSDLLGSRTGEQARANTRAHAERFSWERTSQDQVALFESLLAKA